MSGNDIMAAASKPPVPTASRRREQDLERKLEQMSDLMRRMVRAVRVPESDVDLTPTQLLVLSLLDEGPSRIGVLASAAAAAQNTISEVVARLTRSGLVSKSPDPGDGRAVLVGLTAAGKQALETRRRAMHDYHRSVLGALSARDRQRFVEAFEVLVTMAEAAHAQAMKPMSPTRRNHS